ncbi:hypothetical protein ALC60_05812 [Trachymyrmex zeteki]|uniref:Uncharacterized protein n=1 Tax=Mycetomoellerius zeteki TaxID=64791 RepID=A0A151X448_9HYME|nr:hypothetical protein ALC60_05812 [Trachymyrmex zeteki]
MALLPIWITSGSCFALIHPGTNDVPPTTSRSLMRTIELFVRKATGVHFTFLQILQKQIAGNTLSLGSTKNNIKYIYCTTTAHSLSLSPPPLFLNLYLFLTYERILCNYEIRTQAAQVSGSNGRKLPPFKLLYHAIPYTAATSFCEATVKLAVVHFAQLDRNGVVKVRGEKSISPQLIAISYGIFTQPVRRNRMKLACRRTGCVDVIYRDCYTQTCSFTMHPTVCKGRQCQIISLNLHLCTNDRVIQS